MNKISDLSFAGIIPARCASTRFPGKPLADIGGKYMIQRVYEQASKILDHVYAATDSGQIFDAVESFGGKAVMTGTHHKSGTDRCFEAYEKLNETFDVVINIQGDEPFIQPEQIKTLMNCFSDPDTEIATLAKQISEKDGYEFLSNPNNPKVIVDKRDYALYFSRSVIPYMRGVDKKSWVENHSYYKHIGIYAYRADILRHITALPQSPLEIAESLEQLRWLENGYRIKVGFTDIDTVGVDTPEDLIKIQKMFL